MRNCGLVVMALGDFSMEIQEVLWLIRRKFVKRESMLLWRFEGAISKVFEGKVMEDI